MALDLSAHQVPLNTNKNRAHTGGDFIPSVKQKLCVKLGLNDLTYTVTMGVLREATDALVFGITHKRSHCVLTNKAHTTVMALRSTFIDV